jgi:RimJ/RimL family protein N-acetyltransferase
VLLTMDSHGDSRIIRLLARWRKKHEKWFPSQFPVSETRTASWLKKQVLDHPGRLLFMLRVHDIYMGHLGLFRFDFEKKTCEIDNIIRGRAGYPGLMACAISTMMAWGQTTLGLSGYTLQTTSDNTKALRLYESLGFAETKRIPLIYTKTEEGGEWLPAPAGQQKIKRYDVYMRLKREL